MVAEQAGEIAGYVLVLQRSNSRSYRVYALVVDERFTRQGIGKQLLDWAHDYAKNHGGEQLHLEVQASNVAAVALYTGSGYTRRKYLPGYYQDGSDGLQMVKRLVGAAGI